MKKTQTNKLPNATLRKIASLKISKFQRKLVMRLLCEPPDFMPDDRFTDPTFAAYIEKETFPILSENEKDTRPEEEIFLAFNYTRFKLRELCEKMLKSNRWTFQDIKQLLNLYQRQYDIRSAIVANNMGLVLAMSKRINTQDIEFNDLVSEGNMALLRAAEKFDCSRGWKFSTYACRAILKGFSKVAKLNFRYRSRFSVQLEPEMIKDNHTEQTREVKHNDWVDEVRYVVDQNLANLSDIERSVVKMRFYQKGENRKPMTLKQVGEILGLTKERIRQIQNKALIKLRSIVEERMVTT